MSTMTVIDYMSGLTDYPFDVSVLRTIAADRNVEDKFYIELEQKEKDLLLADLYSVIIYGADTTASISQKNGNTQVSVGSQTINDKTYIYNKMLYLYKKWGDEKLELVSSPQSNILNEIVDATMGNW